MISQATHSVGSAVPDASLVAVEQIMGHVSEEQRRSELLQQAHSVSMAMATSFLGGVGADPDATLLAMQINMRDAGVRRAQSGIEINQSRAEQQKAMQEIALKKAEEAGGFLGISGFLGDVLKAVVVIATTVVAAVCTGGVGAGLAIAGAVLILCAKPITDVAVELGVVSKQDAKAFQLAVELVGAALTLGSGFAGGGAAAGSTAASVASSSGSVGAAAGASVSTVATVGNATAQTVETIKTVLKTIEHVAKVLQAINEGGAAVATKVQSEHLLNGEQAAEEAGHSQELSDAEVESFKSLMKQSSRCQETLERIRKERADAQMAALREW